MLLSAALIAAGCSDVVTADAPGSPQESPDAAPDDSGGPGSIDGGGAGLHTDLDTIELQARPGPFQLTVDRKPPMLGPDAALEVYRPDGTLIGSTGFADNGTALLRRLPAGPADLMVADRDGGQTIRYRVGPLTIPGEGVDDPALYQRAELRAGFNYLPTRDGTTLSAFVTLPGTVGGGPYPTLVEYSGYSPSDPTAVDDPYRLLVPALGYALVQVNVRGTGCSGGSFDAFERIQSLDGYDVIETVAAQAWSAGVGMFGVSYPGIMQLHVASTRPPSLAAITPLSVTDGVDSVLYPGGIYNDGFGQEWTGRVGRQAEAGGQPWAADRVAGGDAVCTANQALRIHNPDLVEVVKARPYITELSQERSARTYAASIDVPTLIGGAWQDEQTGGRFPDLIGRLGSVPVLRAILYNGLHVDAVSGEMLSELIDFLDLYVADRPPGAKPITGLLLGIGLSALFGEPMDVPASRYQGLSAAEARRIYESEPPIEVLFEQGADAPNLPIPRFRAGFDDWPPPATEATTLYLTGRADGPTLAFEPPNDALSASFTTDPDEGRLTTLDDIGRIWTNRPGWSWPAPQPEHSVVATTDPLADDLVLVGNLSADLWVSVDGGSDADIEITVSEVGPDGSETYVQNGWLKLSQRTLSAEATELRPVISGSELDRAPLQPGGTPVLARVEVLPFAHVFRRGSRLRITVDTPGASRPQWRFAVGDAPVEVTIHSSPEQPSRVVMPVVPGLEVPDGRPSCGSLRGQPCRPG